jgi:hypothetical protein
MPLCPFAFPKDAESIFEALEHQDRSLRRIALARACDTNAAQYDGNLCKGVVRQGRWLSERFHAFRNAPLQHAVDLRNRYRENAGGISETLDNVPGVAAYRA